jgi:hypothetical protein
MSIYIFSRIRKAFKCHCGKSYKTSQKLKNHSLLIHSAKNDITLSSTSSSSSQQNETNSNSNVSPLKNSINLVTMKSTINKSTTNLTNASSGLTTTSSTVTKISKEGTFKNINESNKSKLNSPIGKTNYDGLGILTPATSPKNQVQQQNSSSESSTNSIAPDHSSLSASSPISNILSSGFQIFKKHDS